jgi:hypothetical protein
MNPLFDMALATQLSTSFAWLCAIAAHLVNKYANANWQFSVYILLPITVLFMLLPYLVVNPEKYGETHTQQ